MKLIDLLSYIPDECEIGLVRFNGECEEYKHE